MSNSNSQIVVFKVDGEYFGVDVLSVSEIIRIGKINVVPDCAAWIAGMINLRKSVIKVMDFRLKFGYPSRKYDEKSKIIIIRNSGSDNEFGIAVDEVVAVEEYVPKSVRPFDEGNCIRNKLITGILNKKEYLISLIDFNRMTKEF